MSCTPLTDHEAHKLVRQDAGADESHPQADVEFPGALWLHPHEQADMYMHTNKHLSITHLMNPQLMIQYGLFFRLLFDLLQHVCHLPKQVLQEESNHNVNNGGFTVCGY